MCSTVDAFVFRGVAACADAAVVWTFLVRTQGAQSGGSSVLLDVLLALDVGGLGANLLVVLLKGGEILTGLGELTLLHTLTDVPVHEGALGVHQVELVVDAGEDLSDGGRVGDHADGALDLGEVTAGHDGRGLVVDTALEAGGAPVDELDGALGLDGGDGGVDVLGDDVTAVHEAAGHVLTVAGVALGEHGGGLEGGVGDLRDGQLLVVGLLRGDDRGEGGEHEVDTRVRHQVRLELGDVNVEGTVEAEGRGEGRHDLADETVQVGVGRALDVQVAAAEVVDGLVVQHGGDVGVLEERVSRQDGVVGLDDGGRDLGGRVHGVAELGLLAVVNGEALEQERTQAGAGATADGVEHAEALEAGAVVSQLADAVEAQVNDLLTDRVVATRVVVGRVLLTRDQLLGVEELAVGAGADLVDDGRLKVQEDGAGNVLASTSLREEGVESVVLDTNGLVRGHGTVGLDAMFEAEQLPAGVTDLDTSLTDVDRDHLTHVL
eukprot:CAMPEP_0205819214 /NCGR_PEP_ID=MMETSP0206-20130828/1483_1 /ASSEMBLY_ACC=CAM_ASM_000279 /TAXON_ID=36767 /ORGANISM="Euplotes focardii, Strain TN1" /LENGTH=491 /DNA_ID=CAMNT_0053112525 /DNA_START=126 /DNA_END=1602 /DNA_ORIENTATION=+